MPRYYFNVYNDDVTLDEEGVELADAGVARDWARREAVYMAAESVKVHEHLVLSHRIIVMDAAGEEVTRVRFGDAVAIIQ